MSTLTQIMAPHSVEVPEHLIADAEVPVISGKPQRQGDVFIVPMRKGGVARLAPVPPEGIAVVRGENGGNTHLLVADGPVLFAPRESGADMGTLVVPEDATAYLIHPEHGCNAIGEGTYVVRRQREQAEEIRLVQD